MRIHIFIGAEKTIEALRKIYVGPKQTWENSMIFDYDDWIDLDGARLPLHRMSLFQWFPPHYIISQNTLQS